MALFLVLGLFVGYFAWRYYTKQWVEVLLTEDVHHFMQISGQFDLANIRYKSTTGGQEFNSRRSKGNSLPAVTYSILVREEHFPKAQQILSQCGIKG